jgi:hypothetical protein
VDGGGSVSCLARPRLPWESVKGRLCSAQDPSWQSHNPPHSRARDAPLTRAARAHEDDRVSPVAAPRSPQQHRRRRGAAPGPALRSAWVAGGHDGAASSSDRAEEQGGAGRTRAPETETPAYGATCSGGGAVGCPMAAAGAAGTAARRTRRCCRCKLGACYTQRLHGAAEAMRRPGGRPKREAHADVAAASRAGLQRGGPARRAGGRGAAPRFERGHGAAPRRRGAGPAAWQPRVRTHATARVRAVLTR